ncbi:NADP-dependent 3-hydroxy acid dehydrogenase YdfG [Streptoalloteichus tenebrarius]|uniref:NADP-dependent 3-hydroxy acid dehydrogenase YdfG n=1 Tax=Streptoalloteichus tenebrarius (strain ATCC 17920 / DSM 40477 / JCM 4838 / CBS 697.72 / NBRC 16177 / NCIMB 11028 / NRRL B-12390 / A12253. 1 / ISP 5477) TaxID=1933 RepID=A0ABT1HV59_STRSD|nr:SDR family NAD(P)-dependent oxidoreductase [Streptoalloteichus tenebrarius]MCP2259408.1 NADP-dependent 3-hydroxy acid dehydrogenase YdfG [Streptoalloteichus tenebrarius]BFF02350.1 SDR family NAD(P)-dependent oxidoreductase [Streptoalloteichus tenebrarius]
MRLEKGQVAVVTGAASGIGRAVAAALVGRGLHVVMADVEEGPLAEAAAELGDGAAPVVTDVADPAQVDRLAATTLDRFGRVDLLVNNAGVGGGGGPAWTIPVDDWNWVWSVNVGGVVNGIRAFVPHMVAARRGHVVNVASLSGLTSPPFMAPYNATKHAVVTLSETLRAELEHLAPKVGVTVVCPAMVRTRILEADRNRPAGLAERPEQPAWLVEGMRTAFEREMRSAIEPERAAEIILDAVAEDRLHVLTHPESVTHVEARVTALLEGVRA